MAEIAVLVPVLGRPWRAQPLVDSVAASSDGLARVVFIATLEDDDQIAACHATDCETMLAMWEPGRADYQRKINNAFKLTDEPFVFTGADDLTFHDGWADACLAAINQAGEAEFGVCGTYDGANPLTKTGRHSTHSLVRRSYVDDMGASWDGPGTVLSEAYDHQWVDNELCQLAMHRGVWTFARGAFVEHHHPIFDRSVALDDTYRKAMRDGRADQKVYLERRKQWVAA